MRDKRKLIIKLIFIFILIILFINIFIQKQFLKTKSIDDFLFLKLLSNGKYKEDKYKKMQNEDENTKEYRFRIGYNNIDFKSIDLSETIDKETLISEKIAPGTSGSFNIILNSNQELKYKVEFKSINKKPKNLKFKALKNEKVLAEEDTLEKLSEKITGYINKNEEIKIKINWFWNFQSDDHTEITDKQDTEDSGNIKKYKFNICTIGEEIARR